MMTNGCPAHQDKILTELGKVKDHLSGKIQKIEDKLFEPDNGLYTRTRKNTEFREEAEELISEIGANTRFRKSAKKWLSVISIGFLLTTIKVGYDFIKERL